MGKYVFWSLLFIFHSASAEEFDVVIKNGFVIDGSGSPGRHLNLAIDDRRIVYLGPRTDLTGHREIDADGLVVSPGFIDVHNHSEWPILENGDLYNESYVRQGVTLAVVGPDGGLAPGDLRKLKEYIEADGSSIHIGAYIGLNAIREHVMGSSTGSANNHQLEQMRQLVSEGMELGAVGLSTSLMYGAGMHSDTAEVIELAKVVRPYGGIYDTHVRDEAFDLFGSYQEAIEIGEKAGIPVKIAHVKIVVGPHNEGMFSRLRTLINGARSRGTTVVTDQYPYDGAVGADLWEIIAVPGEMRPVDGKPLERSHVARLLKDPETFLELKELNENPEGRFTWIKGAGYTSMRIVDFKQRPEFVGKHIPEVARELGVPEFEAIASLIVDPSADVHITLGSIVEKDIRNFMIQPWNMFSSDGAWSEHSESSLAHPRSTGTYPRILGHYVRELGIMDLPTAVHKSALMPAKFLQFHCRGKLDEGYVADITIFNPATIIDRSDWTHPERYSDGVMHVLVGGRFVLLNGEMTGEKNGNFIPLAGGCPANGGPEPNPGG